MLGEAVNTIAIVAASVLACQSSGPRPAIGTLWNATVVPYLQNDLSSNLESYDAANNLMLPLHEAFQLSSAPPEWKQQFSAYFGRWQALGFPDADNHLNRLQYLYMPSRFLVLCHRYRRLDLIPNQLEDALFNKVKDLWTTLPAGQWAHADFPGIKARLTYKLGLQNPARSYYKGIVDEDFYLFAIASDLKSLRWMTPSSHKDWDPVLDDILGSAYNVFTSLGEFMPDGGWLFQRGVYWDHPDWAYAGQPQMVAGMAKAPIPGIAIDTPHAHRLSLWLTSLAGAYPPGAPRRKVFQSFKAGLRIQFANHVVVPPDASMNFWRTNNYLDGVNGVYRYLYNTTNGSGFDPYQCSGTSTYGWWSFLHDSASRGFYYGLLRSFPLSSQAIATYVGPNTTRQRNPIATEPQCYSNGMRELLARLAYQQTFMVGEDNI